jgi:hypothetical protein
MSLRADDRNVLYDIRDHVGGTVYFTEQNRMCRWDATGLDRCEQILLLLKRYSVIPAKKLLDIQIGLDFITWRKTQPYHLGWEARQEIDHFRQLLSDIRTFKEPIDQVISA